MNASIVILAGDGIGPEVTTEARKVLSAVGEKYNHHFAFDEQLMGGRAIDELGTSLPELAIGLNAATQGNGGLAVGNIVGTNLVNILLILGLAALMRPVEFEPRTLRILYAPCEDGKLYFAMMSPRDDKEAAALPINPAVWGSVFPMLMPWADASRRVYRAVGEFVADRLPGPASEAEEHARRAVGSTRDADTTESLETG